MSKQTKIYGKVDFSPYPKDVVDEFFRRGHIVISNRHGIDYALSDIVAKPLGLRTNEDGTTSMLALVYDGGDKAQRNALKVRDTVNNPNRPGQYSFVVASSYVTSLSSSAKKKKRLYVYLEKSEDSSKYIKRIDTYEGFSNLEGVALDTYYASA